MKSHILRADWKFIAFVLIVSLLFFSSCVSKKEFRAYQTDIDDRLAVLNRDTDNDGVPDFYDKDSETPEGVAVDGSGKALDVDGDGIPDFMDEDPFTSRSATVDANGRAIDSDADGVPDYMDHEPNTPKGTKVNFKGVSIPSKTGGESQNTQLEKNKIIYKTIYTSDTGTVLAIKPEVTTLIHLDEKLKVGHPSILTISLNQLMNDSEIRNELVREINKQRVKKNLDSLSAKQITEGNIPLGDYFTTELHLEDSSFTKSLIIGTNFQSFNELGNNELKWSWKLIPQEKSSGTSQEILVIVKSLDSNKELIKAYQEPLSFEIVPRKTWFEDLVSLTRNPQWQITAVLFPVIGFFAGIWKEKRTTG
ncbi:thrombospondin type 3 repeat-containing protein [Owenweeksia hongkongensis DSM 17368]|uniref:Thrombospondin type 3 repeat-containing protein n=1 Tax=Owenweeksia hongkongensis (strain DSM 17368 / CIP 108786 / JCM 12287 / NRRL B-23963 / UST20020801) TaxID=926562 RepID=G8R8K1_OWEHD|nr:thrombospondin type 3 repeat-containing protein [Owenweeksia hongkongensis]AEV31383.1 thrombospondin type 3 repeat-containing protein [Owenweeksia hongkongensis DSM 17368]